MNPPDKTLTPKLEHEDLLRELSDFVIENRGTNAFSTWTKEEVYTNLHYHWFKHTLIFARDDQNKIGGVLTYEIQKWIPMEVYVENLVGKGYASKLLHKLAKRLPNEYYIYAYRRDGKRKIYDGPKTLKTFRTLYGKRRLSATINEQIS